ncbi:MAG: peptidoglycan-binding protein [Planctomycetes bacterium]|nr:peptidoglycan-binding protein [Planctomycetota bacterium]
MPDTTATTCPSERSDRFTNRLRRALRKRADAPSTSPDAAPQGAADAVPELVGQGDYVVKRGDCVSSIAAVEGHLWQTIWDDAANAELKEIRKDPNVLATGDRLTIPPLKERTETGQTDMRHKFVRVGQPTIFRLRLAQNGKPIANRPYTIQFECGHKVSSATNDEGRLQCPMPSTARRAKLCVQEKDETLEYDLKFGHLEPVEHLTGVQQRLRHFGYYSGPTNGTQNKQTTAALKSFQQPKARELETTGDPDDPTRARLRDEHGA